MREVDEEAETESIIMAKALSGPAAAESTAVGRHYIVVVFFLNP